MGTGEPGPNESFQFKPLFSSSNSTSLLLGDFRFFNYRFVATLVFCDRTVIYAMHGHVSAPAVQGTRSHEVQSQLATLGIGSLFVHHVQEESRVGRATHVIVTRRLNLHPLHVLVFRHSYFHMVANHVSSVHNLLRDVVRLEVGGYVFVQVHCYREVTSRSHSLLIQVRFVLVRSVILDRVNGHFYCLSVFVNRFNVQLFSVHGQFRAGGVLQNQFCQFRLSMCFLHEPVFRHPLVNTTLIRFSHQTIYRFFIFLIFQLTLYKQIFLFIILFFFTLQDTQVTQHFQDTKNVATATNDRRERDRYYHRGTSYGAFRRARDSFLRFYFCKRLPGADRPFFLVLLSSGAPIGTF